MHPEVVDRRDVGWLRTPAARASCSKRFSRSGSCENDAGSTLIATSRPRRGSRARRPRPSRRAERGQDLVRTELGSSGKCHVSYRGPGFYLADQLHAVDEVQVRKRADVAVGIALSAPASRAQYERSPTPATSAGIKVRHDSFRPVERSSRKTFAGFSAARWTKRNRPSELSWSRPVFLVETRNLLRFSSGERIEIGLPVRPFDHGPSPSKLTIAPW